MNQEPENNISRRMGGVIKYFGLIMGIVYLVLGILFYRTPIIPNMEPWARYSISGLLVVYGGFRFWRAIRK